MTLHTAILDRTARNVSVPEIDLGARPVSRKFSGEYKEMILAEHEAALDGENGSVCR